MCIPLVFHFSSLKISSKTMVNSLGKVVSPCLTPLCSSMGFVFVLSSSSICMVAFSYMILMIFVYLESISEFSKDCYPYLDGIEFFFKVNKSDMERYVISGGLLYQNSEGIQVVYGAIAFSESSLFHWLIEVEFIRQSVGDVFLLTACRGVFVWILVGSFQCFVLSSFLNIKVTSELSIILLNIIFRICSIFLPPIFSISTDILSSPAHLLFSCWFSANLIPEVVISVISCETVLSIVLSVMY